MLSSDENKAGGKPNQRKGKPAPANKKGEQRKAKAAQPRDPQPDQVQDIAEETAASETGAAVALSETAAPVPSAAGTSPIVPAVSEASVPVSYRAIVDAWGDYSRTSLEQTKVYFEKLAGVRSLGGAFEVQAEFARQACETFVAESQRIRELHGEMARQRLKRLEGFMEKMTQGALGARGTAKNLI
jgi:hypothetical protein